MRKSRDVARDVGETCWATVRHVDAKMMQLELPLIFKRLCAVEEYAGFMQ